MPLRKARGDMYPFITHTWNPIKGKCPHGCSYCYVDRIARRFGAEQKAPHLDECELRANLGCGNDIFVGSSIDLFAEDIDAHSVNEVMRVMTESIERHGYNHQNKYLLQTKNPKRAFVFFSDFFPATAVLAITAETNRQYPAVMGSAPTTLNRLAVLPLFRQNPVMVTVEPIMDFDTPQFASALIDAHAQQINIGADSGNNGLPEPDAGKVRELIDILARNGARVLLKKNLRRILPEHELYEN